MMLTLKRSGKLDNLAGLLVGGFTATKKDEEEIDPIRDKFLMTVEEIIFEKVKEYSYPVCFHFPAGHMKLNLALKLGSSYQLQVNTTQTLLSEWEPPMQIMQMPIQDNMLKLATDSLLK
jgi:muramoyltetrapeptide carboxypeptidase